MPNQRMKHALQSQVAHRVQEMVVTTRDGCADNVVCDHCSSLQRSCRVSILLLVCLVLSLLSVPSLLFHDDVA